MTDSNEWGVKIAEDVPSGNFKIFIYSKGPGNTRAYVSNIKLGELKIISTGEMIEECMTVTESMMKSLFQAFQERGMKPIEQSYVEGKLEAVQEHLKDMRSLVFEDKEIIINEVKE